MKQIAYLCGRDTISWSKQRRRDAYEHDLAFRHFKEAFSRRNYLLVEVLWQDSGIDWKGFESAIIGSAWDYTKTKSEFIRALMQISSNIPLFNNMNLVSWNIDKRYLRELNERGIKIIPTVWDDRLSDVVPEQIFDELETKTIIIKPTLGACSEGQILIERGKRQDLSLQRNKPVMLQRFYTSIATDGEKSVVFYGDQFSHGVLKKPARHDYRVQSIFDGTESAYVPTSLELEICNNIITKLPEKPLYCRVDLVDLPSGAAALMECEVIEPYLYPTYSHDESALFVEQYFSAMDRWRASTLL